MPEQREQQSRAPLVTVRGGGAKNPRLNVPAEAAGVSAVRRGALLARPFIEQ